jgi:hypothetical protein
MSAKKLLKAFVRLDAKRQIVPGSLILRPRVPKDGHWMEIPTSKCCSLKGQSIYVENTSAVDFTVNGIVIPAAHQALVPRTYQLKFAAASAHATTLTLKDSAGATIAAPTDADGTGSYDLTTALPTLVRITIA